jgi:predicted TIM-barrel fold metal-dependent hydrolase
MPYQVGRFDAGTLRPDRGGGTRFRDRLRWLYYDTVLYTAAALELLVKTVGADRCLFGSECPGVGSSTDPDTGQTLDNIRPHFERFAWLSETDREAIFSGNAKRVFNLKLS